MAHGVPDFVIEGELSLTDKYSTQIDDFEQRIASLRDRITQGGAEGGGLFGGGMFGEGSRIGGIGESIATSPTYVLHQLEDFGHNIIDTVDQLHKLQEGVEHLKRSASESTEGLQDAAEKNKGAFDDIVHALGELGDKASSRGSLGKLLEADNVTGGVAGLANLDAIAGKIGSALAGVTEIAGSIGELATGPLGQAAAIAMGGMAAFDKLSDRAKVGDVYRGRESALNYLAGEDMQGAQKDLVDALHGYVTDVQAADLLLGNYLTVQGHTNDKIKDLGDTAAVIADFMGGDATQVGGISAKLAEAIDKGNIGQIGKISGGLYDFTEQEKQWSARTGQSFAGLTDDQRQSLLMQWMSAETESLMSKGMGWENLQARTETAGIAKQKLHEDVAKQLSEAGMSDLSFKSVWDKTKTAFYQMLDDLIGETKHKADIDTQFRELSRMGISTHAYAPATLAFQAFSRRNEYWQENQMGTPVYTPRMPGDVLPDEATRRQSSLREEFLAAINDAVNARINVTRPDQGLSASIMPSIVGANVMGSPIGYLQSQSPGFKGMLTDTGEFATWISEAKKLPGISEEVSAGLDDLGKSMAKLSNQQIKQINEAMSDTGNQFQALAEKFLGPKARLEQLIGMYDTLPTNLQQAFQGRGTQAASEYINDRILGAERPNETFRGVVSGARQITSLMMGTAMNPRDAEGVSAEEIARAQEKIIEDWVNFNSRLEKLHGDSVTQMTAYRRKYLQELNQLMEGNREDLKDAQDLYAKRMKLRSSAAGVLTSRLTPTQEDFLATDLGEYKEAPMEEVRQLQGFIQYGGDELKKHLDDANYQKSIKLLSERAIQEALSGDDRRLKLEAMQRQREFLDLRRLPEDLGNFDAAYKEWFEGQGQKEKNMQFLEQHLKSLGYSGDIGEDLKKFMGITTPEMELKTKIKASENARSDFIKLFTGNDDGVLDLKVKLELAEEAKDKEADSPVGNKLFKMLFGVDDKKGIDAKSPATAIMKALSDGMDSSVKEIDYVSSFISELHRQTKKKEKEIKGVGKIAGGTFLKGVTDKIDDKTSHIFDSLVDAVLNEIYKRNSNGSGNGDGSGESDPVL